MKFLVAVMEPTIKTAIGMADSAMNTEGIGIELDAPDLTFVGSVVSGYFAFISRKAFHPMDLGTSITIAHSAHHYIEHLDQVFTEVHTGTLAVATKGDSLEVMRAIHEINRGKAAQA